MTIEVAEVPNCTWALDGTRLYCTHDEEGVHETVEQDLLPDQRFIPSLHTKHVVICADPDCDEDITEFYGATA